MVIPAPRWRAACPTGSGRDLDLVQLAVQPREPRSSAQRAVVKLTGQRANKVVPSRWKTECRARWMKM
jgi:hypothetical protein